MRTENPGSEEKRKGEMRRQEEDKERTTTSKGDEKGKERRTWNGRGSNKGIYVKEMR